MGRNGTTMSKNGSYTETDEFITRTHVMPMLWDDEIRTRIIEEHRNNPIGVPGLAGKPGIQHSEELGHVLDKLRRHPTKDKEVIIELDPFKKYAIGILSGYRGGPVTVLHDAYYKDRDEIEHAIFLRRVEKILKLYPKPAS